MTISSRCKSSVLSLAKIIVVTLIGWVAAMPNAQSAPSFDCVQAKSTIEKAICSNNWLSLLDAKLGETFQTAIVAQPEAGKLTLRDDQRHWVMARDKICADKITRTKDKMILCLEVEYKKRLEELSNHLPQTEIEVAGSLGLLNKIGEVAGYSPKYPWKAEDQRLVFSQYDATGNTQQVLSFDPATRKMNLLGDHLNDSGVDRVFGRKDGGVCNSPNIFVIWKNHKYSLLKDGIKREDGTSLLLKPNECPISPKIYDQDLFYTANQGTIVDVDLSAFQLKRIFPRKEGAGFVNYDVSANLLFTLPEDENGNKLNMEVFDLTTGRQLVQFPFRADIFAIHDGILAATEKARSFRELPVISLYRINPAKLVNSTASFGVLQGAYINAQKVFAATHSAYDALAEIEKVSVDALTGTPHLTPPLWSMAEDYASWQSAIFSKRKDGLAMLERLSDEKPNDTQIMRRLAGAYLRDYLFTGQSSQFEKAHKILANSGEWSGGLDQLAQTQSPPGDAVVLDFGAFSNQFYFWKDKLIIGRWKNSAPNVAAYDRASLKLLWESELKPADSDYQDNISAITFANNQIQAWMDYRYDPKDRPDVAVINPDNGQFKLRSINNGINGALEVKNGVVVCQERNASFAVCTLLNKETLNVLDAEPKLHGAFMGLVWRDGSASQEDIERFLMSSEAGCEDSDLAAANARWLVGSHYAEPGGYTLSFCGLQGQTNGWVKIGEHHFRYPRVILTEKDDQMLVLGKYKDNQSVWALDIGMQKLITLFDDAGIAVTNGKWLWISNERDIYMYDLAERRIAAVLPHVIPDGFQDNGFGIDKAKIMRLLYDNSRLIVLTFDGRYSRVFNLKDLEAYAEKMEVGFAQADKLTLQ